MLPRGGPHEDEPAAQKNAEQEPDRGVEGFHPDGLFKLPAKPSQNFEKQSKHDASDYPLCDC